MNLMTAVTGENLYKTRVGVTDLGGEIIERTFGVCRLDILEVLQCLEADLNIKIGWM